MRQRMTQRSGMFEVGEGWRMQRAKRRKNVKEVRANASERGLFSLSIRGYTERSSVHGSLAFGTLHNHLSNSGRPEPERREKLTLVGHEVACRSHRLHRMTLLLEEEYIRIS